MKGAILGYGDKTVQDLTCPACGAPGLQPQNSTGHLRVAPEHETRGTPFPCCGPVTPWVTEWTRQHRALAFCHKMSKVLHRRNNEEENTKEFIQQIC